jgi:hypothetical protein
MSMRVASHDLWSTQSFASGKFQKCPYETVGSRRHFALQGLKDRILEVEQLKYCSDRKAFEHRVSKSMVVGCCSRRSPPLVRPRRLPRLRVNKTRNKPLTISTLKSTQRDFLLRVIAQTKFQAFSLLKQAIVQGFSP